MATISVIIPVFHGEKTIESLSERLIKVLHTLTPDYEIILINDASPDASWKKIEYLCSKNKQIKGLDLNRNSGQHAAISSGLKYASGQKIIIMDCDLQDAPEDLPGLWAKSQGYDIVMARRTKRNDPILRRFSSWCFHQVLSLKRRKRTDPAIANFAIYDRKVIREYFESHENQAFSVLSLKKNYTFATIDVIQKTSARGKSGYSLFKLFSLAFSLLFPKRKNINNPLFTIQKIRNIAVENYGIKLTPLSGEKIEMVRQWRNNPKISQFMKYREYITPEMQQKWFESICNLNNFFFMIEYEGKEIGLCDIKNIDYQKKIAEGGIFIDNEQFLNSDIAIRASLCAWDFGSETLGLTTGIAKILKSNKRAIQYNSMLGYALQPGQDNIENQVYILTLDTYLKKREYITRLLTH